MSNLTIKAEFFSNGTCAYKVEDEGGAVLDHNVVGIANTWAKLLRILAYSDWAQTPRQAPSVL